MSDTISKNREPIYKNRMEKCRFLKKLKEILPSSPIKRAAITFKIKQCIFIFS